MPVKKRKVLRGNIQKITKPALTRLARVAGVKSLSGDMTNEIRNVLTVTLDKVVKNAVTITQHLRKHTVDAEAIYHALPKYMYSVKPPTKACKLHPPGTGEKRLKPGVKALREIKYYQNQSNCLHIPRASFDKLVRELSQEYMGNLRFTEQGMLILQYSMEKYLIQLFQDANLDALHANRLRVESKDIQLAKRMRS